MDLLTTDTKPLYSSVEEAATKLQMDEFNSKSARGRNASSKHNVEAPGFGGFGHHESGPSSSSHGRGHDSRGQHYGKSKQHAVGVVASSSIPVGDVEVANLMQLHQHPPQMLLHPETRTSHVFYARRQAT